MAEESEIKAFEVINEIIIRKDEDTSLSKAAKKKKGHQDYSPELLNLKEESPFQIACRRAGIEEDDVAKRLKKLIMYNRTIVDRRTGVETTEPDSSTNLKAIEIWARVFGYWNRTEGAKHLHLHGPQQLSDDELDKALQDAEQD